MGQGLQLQGKRVETKSIENRVPETQLFWVKLGILFCNRGPKTWAPNHRERIKETAFSNRVQMVPTHRCRNTMARGFAYKYQRQTHAHCSDCTALWAGFLKGHVHAFLLSPRVCDTSHGV
jgi:hypothetical protein